jgi:hypothetical protein
MNAENVIVAPSPNYSKTVPLKMSNPNQLINYTLLKMSKSRGFCSECGMVVYDNEVNVGVCKMCMS